MRLSRSYQPRTLDEVVGQPAVIRRLKRLVALPQPCCLLFEGLGGVSRAPRPRPSYNTWASAPSPV